MEETQFDTVVNKDLLRIFSGTTEEVTVWLKTRRDDGVDLDDLDVLAGGETRPMAVVSYLTKYDQS